MVAEASLVVDIEALEVCLRGPAIAGIWLVCDGEAFPAAGWSDFAVVVWVGGVGRCSRHAAATAFDGRFWES